MAQAHTFEYAKTILDLMTRDPVDDPNFVVKPKCLIIGGGIANFTNVASTFNGIIKVPRLGLTRYVWLIKAIEPAR